MNKKFIIVVDKAVRLCYDDSVAAKNSNRQNLDK